MAELEAENSELRGQLASCDAGNPVCSAPPDEAGLGCTKEDAAGAAHVCQAAAMAALSRQTSLPHGQALAAAYAPPTALAASAAAAAAAGALASDLGMAAALPLPAATTPLTQISLPGDGAATLAASFHSQQLALGEPVQFLPEHPYCDEHPEAGQAALLQGAQPFIELEAAGQAEAVGLSGFDGSYPFELDAAGCWVLQLTSSPAGLLHPPAALPPATAARPPSASPGQSYINLFHS